MADPRVRFCPACGALLSMAERFGRLRPTCSSCGYVVFLEPKLVAVVIVWHGDQILLGRRSIDPGQGKWSFFGGYIERGEEVEEAARRELQEETGLDLALEGFVGLYSSSGNPNVLAVFSARIKGKVPPMQPQLEEVSELAFFPTDALPPLAFPSDTRILEDWRKLQNK